MQSMPVMCNTVSPAGLPLCVKQSGQYTCTGAASSVVSASELSFAPAAVRTNQLVLVCHNWHRHTQHWAPCYLPCNHHHTHLAPTHHRGSAGRHKAFNSLDMSVTSFQQAGVLMALSELNLQYKAPLRAGDIFFITTAIAQVRLRCDLYDWDRQQMSADRQAVFVLY